MGEHDDRLHDRRDGLLRRWRARSSDLPAGAHLTWARGVMAISPPRRLLRGPSLSWLPARPGAGTPLVWCDEPDVAWFYFGGQHPRTVAPEVLSTVWIRRLLQSPQPARQLSGVFALVVFDKQHHTTIALGDRLGVQGLHVGRGRDGAWHLSTHLAWLLLALGHDGAVNDRAFTAHVAFGYGVDPDRDVYANVHAVRPGEYLRLSDDGSMSMRYWRMPEPTRMEPVDSGGLVGALRSASAAAADGADVFLGLTAGKDSLCLASAMADICPRTGTLGAYGCADLLQGAELARLLGWPHVMRPVCSTADFFRWADYVAFQSAGLATTSYVDMAAFVSRAVPRGCAFVMGEGGECVRDFFRASGRPALQALVDDYMTPRPYLAATLAPRLLNRMGTYPADFVDRLYAMSGARDVDGFLSSFYRTQRMSGNFSLRHAVLSPLRPKISPFLDSRFIDIAYPASTSQHEGSALHRRLIAHARPDLLPFFEAPIRTVQGTQNWPLRFPRLATRLRQRLAEDLRYSDDVLDPPGVLALCDAAAAQPSRAMYHLLRLFSFVRWRALLRTSGRDRLRSLETRRVVIAPEPDQTPLRRHASLEGEPSR